MLQRLKTRGKLLAAGAALVALGTLIGRAQQDSADSPFATPTIDIGMCVSDAEKSLAFYKDALGFREAPSFDVPAQFSTDTGLSNNLPLHVHVLTLGEGPGATKLKLIQTRTSPGARVDQSFIHSTYGIRYLTIVVKDVNAAVKHAAEHGAKPIAKCPQPLPAGFPEGLALANFRDPDGNLIELVGPWKKP
ncbi:VOC family protein [Planctellipticum variicoloris]|uniref:VOC family protein n=1 Tax=Planctellipticum variicoloris TaxID=3064265 RepID=UPI003013CC0B|nr:VOC family protein [Planctomycetaceae bacterium SH412]